MAIQKYEICLFIHKTCFAPDIFKFKFTYLGDCWRSERGNIVNPLMPGGDKKVTHT